MFHESIPRLAAVFLCLAASGALAAEKSSVAYYPVTGKTAAEVYANIKKASPRVARNSTFAFTLIATKTAKKTVNKDNACRHSSFNTSAIYVFNLPRHSNPAALPAAARAKWGAFVDYLLRHEEGHRTIWRQCFKEYDAQALELSAKTCEKLDAAREKLFTAIKRKCVAQDEAYDVIFRKEVLREPFVAAALKGDGSNRK